MPAPPTIADSTPRWHPSFVAASQVLGLKGDDAIALLEPVLSSGSGANKRHQAEGPTEPDTAVGVDRAPTPLSQMFGSAAPREARVCALADVLRDIGLSFHALDAARVAKASWTR